MSFDCPAAFSRSGAAVILHVRSTAHQGRGSYLKREEMKVRSIRVIHQGVFSAYLSPSLVSKSSGPTTSLRPTLWYCSKMEYRQISPFVGNLSGNHPPNLLLYQSQRMRNARISFSPSRRLDAGDVGIRLDQMDNEALQSSDDTSPED